MQFNYPKTLYHGTNEKWIDMTIDQRKKMGIICDFVSRSSFDFLSKEGFKWTLYGKEKEHFQSLFGDEFLNICNAYALTEARYNGNPNYEYVELYLTNIKDRAINYARNSYAFGEQGRFAYTLYSAASKISDPKTIWSAEEVLIVNNFVTLVQMKGNALLVEFDNIAKEHLLDEKGRVINWADENDFHINVGCSFRLKSSANISLRQGKISII